MASYSWILLHILVLVWGSEAVIKFPPNHTVPAIIFFGDSIVDQGNNNNLKTIAKSNFLPYGKDLNGGEPTGRFSNARTPPDLIAEEMGIKELVPAYLDPNIQPEDLLTGVSFASGGAGLDPLTAQSSAVLTLSQQLDLFEEYIGKLKALVGEDRTNFILTNMVCFVVAGSNDIVNTYFSSSVRQLQYTVSAYADLMVSLASDFIKEIYNLGVRRIAVYGVPPVGCLPSQRTIAGGLTRGCVGKYNEAAQLVNSKLSSGVNSLANSLPQVTMAYINIYDPLLDLIQNPQNYGLEVVDKGCCGTGKIEVIYLCNKVTPLCSDDTKYLFWDSFHPTERGYAILVGRLLQQIHFWVRK